jgi:hypothetical protein
MYDDDAGALGEFIPELVELENENRSEGITFRQGDFFLPGDTKPSCEIPRGCGLTNSNPVSETDRGFLSLSCESDVKSCERLCRALLGGRMSSTLSHLRRVPSALLTMVAKFDFASTSEY